MSGPVPIAFYAPLKSPRHAEPSGDRTMGRLLWKALQAAGFAPELASELRTLERTGEPAAQERLRAASIEEAGRLVAAFEAKGRAARPRAWFTYHVYYKAPDWVGPRVAAALGIPYVVAEASRASKRAGGRWAVGHAGAEAALDRARAIFVLTARDRAALERDRRPGQQLIDLPPFLDLDAWSPALPPRRRSETPRLVTVAMMRRGDKLASYALLADALGRLLDRPWGLDVVGDGEARAEVAALFAPFGPRVRLHGRVEDRRRLAALYAGADLFVWPAVNEAYGMVLVEAQAHGCPVVAGDYGGVASAVEDGRTGVLTPPGDVAAFAAAVGALVDDPRRRAALGEAAASFVRDERSLAQAAAVLRAGLLQLVAAEAPA